MDIFGSKETRLREDGIVRIPKEFVEYFPHKLYATVQRVPEGNYVACIPELPSSDLEVFFKMREVVRDENGDGLVGLGDLCASAEIAQLGNACEISCVVMPLSRWGVPYSLEIWSKEVNTAFGNLNDPALRHPRALWPDPAKSF